MTTTDLLRSSRDRILQLAAHHGARNVRIFGSAVRGEAKPESDIDFLVEMDSGRSLLDLIELSQDLETLLQRKVDVLTDKGLSPYLEHRIHAEAVPLVWDNRGDEVWNGVGMSGFLKEERVYES
jgi:predicted nucleotidyltransferase